MKISYLRRDQLDKAKWDLCIDNATNGLIYAYAHYLDAMSDHWDALVGEDYGWVMPLTWKKKYGVHYLYQPVFTASLGIFGKDITEKTVKSFLEKVPTKFKWWDIYLNRNNFFSITGFPMYQRNNYILPLAEPYPVLENRFAASHKRNLRRAADLGNSVNKDIALEAVIRLAKEQARNYASIESKDYDRFTALFRLLKENGAAETYGVYSAQNRLVASCVYFFSHGRAYYILVGNDPGGRASGASHLLIDAFIREYAGSGLTLDFEGSNIPSLAFFYKSFGSLLETYPGLQVNRLPLVARLLKSHSPPFTGN